jgi:hypothetical protein
MPRTSGSAATTSGAGQVKGAHEAADVGAADETGAVPGSHEKTPTRQLARAASG